MRTREQLPRWLLPHTKDRVHPVARLGVGLIFGTPRAHRVLHVRQLVHPLRSGREGLSHVHAATKSDSKTLSAVQGAAGGRDSLGSVCQPSAGAATEVSAAVEDGHAASAASARTDEPRTSASVVVLRPRFPDTRASFAAFIAC